MTTNRSNAYWLLCVLASGCTYHIVLEKPDDTRAAADESMTALGSAMLGKAGQPAAPADAMATDKGKAKEPVAPAADKDAASKSVGGDKDASASRPSPTPPAPPLPPTDAPPDPQDCSARVVSRSKPCDTDPDPCNLNSGFEGDEYCLKPPPDGKGIQIHFGPNDYGSTSNRAQYLLQPGEEFNSSVLAHIPLTEAKFWNHVTIHTRPGVHHWTSMGAPGDAKEGFYDDTGCGAGSVFGPGGFGGGQNLIYDNPPHGVAAPENEGIGHRIEGNTSACVQMHTYNFTDKPRLREMWVNLYFIDEAKVTQTTGSIGLVGALGLNLPPGQRKELSYSARFTAAGRIIQLFGQRNQWTPRLAAWLNDELIYDSHDWVESTTFNYDSLTTNPPIDGMNDGAISGIVPFAAGDTLKYSCFIDNQSDQVLRFKNEIAGGEMCNLWGSTVGGSVNGSFQ